MKAIYIRTSRLLEKSKSIEILNEIEK